MPSFLSTHQGLCPLGLPRLSPQLPSQRHQIPGPGPLVARVTSVGLAPPTPRVQSCSEALDHRGAGVGRGGAHRLGTCLALSPDAPPGQHTHTYVHMAWASPLRSSLRPD